jgi:tRNA A-37 threonylcarbamoyl transferase component Bud32
LQGWALLLAQPFLYLPDTLTHAINLMTEKEILASRIEELTGWKLNIARLKIVTDTSDWMRINRGDVLRVGGQDYVIKGNMREPRFGIDDQPKLWVFSAISLADGSEKIIKTVYDEEFYAHIGFLKIRCYRSQDKESAVMESCRNDARFMQGITAYDDENNNVRIIDYIRGKTFFHYLPDIKKKHEEYFHEDLGDILHNLKNAIEGIRYLHKNGLCHGDIRNDHIIIEQGSRLYRWIDFDLNQDVNDFDLWSLGNILSYAVAKGILTFTHVLKSPDFSNHIKQSLTAEDCSAFYEYRIMNLKKVYPYIPPKLSKLLNHFTIKPIAYYTGIDEFISDYEEMLDSEFPVIGS